MKKEDCLKAFSRFAKGYQAVIDRDHEIMEQMKKDIKLLEEVKDTLEKTCNVLNKYNASLKKIIVMLFEDEDYLDWFLNNPEAYSVLKTELLLEKD